MSARPKIYGHDAAALGGNCAKKPAPGKPGTGFRSHSALADRTFGDHAVNEQDDDRTADGQQPGRQREELVDAHVEQCIANESTQEGTDDAQDQGDQNATALTSRQDCLSNCSGDEAQNQKCEKAHFIVPSSSLRRHPDPGCASSFCPNTN